MINWDDPKWDDIRDICLKSRLLNNCKDFLKVFVLEIINNDLGINFPEHLNNSDIDQDILYKLDHYIKQYTSLTNDQSLKMAAQTQHMIYQNNDISGNYIILQTYNYTHWVGCKKYIIYHPTDLQNQSYQNSQTSRILGM